MTLRIKFLTLIAALTVSFGFAEPPVEVTVEHNSNNDARASFKFKSVPSPAKDDAATKAKLTLVDGDMDSNGADLSALTDGMLPTDQDQPEANFFFDAGTAGGRFRLDLGSVIEISQVNTYSWHPNTRGPQLYKLYASDGADPRFNGAPKRGVDPTTCGWHVVATVNTVPQNGDEGGQYGVGITDTSGSLGKYRYLLFDCYVTETADEFGNTFYSEVDVVEKR